MTRREHYGWLSLSAPRDSHRALRLALSLAHVTRIEQQGIGHHISSHHQRTGLPLTKSKSGPTLTITQRTMGAVPRRGRLKAKQVEVMKVTDLISI